MTPQSANSNRFPNAESPQLQGLDSDYINTQQVVQQLQMHSRQSSLIDSMGNLQAGQPGAHIVNESPYGTRMMMMSRMPKKPIPPPPPRTPSKPMIGGPLPPPPPGRGSNQSQRVYEAMGRPVGSPMGALNNSMDRRTPADHRDLMIKNAPPPYSAVNAIKQSE